MVGGRGQDSRDHECSVSLSSERAVVPDGVSESTCSGALSMFDSFVSSSHARRNGWATLEYVEVFIRAVLGKKRDDDE